MPLAIFAHRFYPAKDPRIRAITKRTNAAYRACGSPKAATKFDLAEVPGGRGSRPEGSFRALCLVPLVHRGRALSRYQTARRNPGVWSNALEIFPDLSIPQFGRLRRRCPGRRVHRDRRPRIPPFPHSDRHPPVSDQRRRVARAPSLSSREFLFGAATGRAGPVGILRGCAAPIWLHARE